VSSVIFLPLRKEKVVSPTPQCWIWKHI